MDLRTSGKYNRLGGNHIYTQGVDAIVETTNATV